MDLKAIQDTLTDLGFDGWLFYDFHDRDQIAARVLEMDTNRFASRRWFYFIPASGTPQKLVHAIEPWRCDHLPGDKNIYLPWQQQQDMLKNMLGDAKNIAMQYSPDNAIPYVSIVDGGTIDLIRSFGVNVVSSANLVSIFESHLDEKDRQSHAEAGEIMQMVKDKAFEEIGKRIKNGENPKEYEIQAYMHELMRENGMTWDDGPIVAVNEHAADPHFEPTQENSHAMKEGDLVLLDLWAKKDLPGAIYYDITWMGFIGAEVPEKLEKIFKIAADARDAGINIVKERFTSGVPVYGWEVDDTVRKVIIDAGYGQYFIHRTGHNIAEEVHGSGTHIDNLETKDERNIIKGSCFSIEPGIYMPEEKIGFRTEIDIFVTDDGDVQVYGPIQEKIITIL